MFQELLAHASSNPLQGQLLITNDLYILEETQKALDVGLCEKKPSPLCELCQKQCRYLRSRSGSATRNF